MRTTISLLPTPVAGDSERQRLAYGAGNAILLGALLPTPRASDSAHGGPNQRDSAGNYALPAISQLLPTPRSTRGGSATETVQLLPTPTANEDSYRLNGNSQASQCLSAQARRGELDEGRWGIYAPAIARWERILDRSAPEPTDEKRRLNPDFVSWMMGFPEGWLHGSRTQQLKQLGNAVVPQQGEHAIRALVARIVEMDTREGA